MAAIKQIAEKAGVSSAAVSRVLNYDESISVNEETRQAIFAGYNIGRTGELITVKSSLFSPTGIFVMSNKVIKNPATGIYINTLPLIEPSL